MFASCVYKCIVICEPKKKFLYWTKRCTNKKNLFHLKTVLRTGLSVCRALSHTQTYHVARQPANQPVRLLTVYSMLCRAANNPVGYRGVGRCPAFFFFFGRDVGQRLSYSCPLSNFFEGEVVHIAFPCTSFYFYIFKRTFICILWTLVASPFRLYQRKHQELRILDNVSK